MLFSFALKGFKTAKDRMYKNTHSGLISNGKKKKPRKQKLPNDGKKDKLWYCITNTIVKIGTKVSYTNKVDKSQKYPVVWVGATSERTQVA